MKENIQHEICVVGGGPAGLTSAYMFAECGFDVALIAPARKTQDRRTTAFLHYSVQIMETLGFWTELKSFAAPMDRIRIVDDTGRLLRSPETVFSSSEIGLETFGYNLPNSYLLAELDKRTKGLKNLTIIDASATDLTVSEQNARISLSTEQEISCELVVGADGRNSFVRKSAGIQSTGRKYEQSALVVNLRHSFPHNNESTEFHTPNGPFTLIPLPGERCSLVCVDLPETVQSLENLDAESLADEFERRSKSILGKIEIEGESQVFPLSGQIASSSGQNRCVLIGDSAHVLPPFGAQGLNLGFRDIGWLGEIVVNSRSANQDIGAADTISKYNSVRERDAKVTTAMVDLLNRSLVSSILPGQALRTLGIYFANRITPFRKFVMHQGIGFNQKVPKLAEGIPLTESS